MPAAFVLSRRGRPPLNVTLRCTGAARVVRSIVTSRWVRPRARRWLTAREMPDHGVEQTTVSQRS